MNLPSSKQEVFDNNLAKTSPHSLFQQFKSLYKKSLASGHILTLESFHREFFGDQIKNWIHKNNFHRDFFAIEEWLKNMTHFDFLSFFWQDNDLKELILRTSGEIIVEKKGSFSLPLIPPLLISSEDLEMAMDTLALSNGISWNFTQPFCSFYCQLNGHKVRISLSHRALSPSDYGQIFIRKMQLSLYQVKDFKIPFTLEEQISQWIIHKKNILISGAAGSGKTTFLRSLLTHIPQRQHVVILEDTFELQVSSPFFTHLLSNEENGNKSLTNLCAYALRMRPDRFIVGEIRSFEVVSFILAMNTGHRGLMSSLHASNAREVPARLSLLYSLYSQQKNIDYPTIMSLVCRNIDYIIHMENREIKEVAQVIGCEKGQCYTEEIYQRA